MSGSLPPDPVRAAGPPLVTAGRPGARRLIVLDPAGSAKHDGLPATWRPLADRHEILWYRLPAAGAWAACVEALAAPAGRLHRGDLVVSGPFAGEALRMAARFPGTLRSVLLVDPAAEGTISPGDAQSADETWFVRHGNEIAVLRELGIDVEMIAHSTDEADDQLPPPLPLGHGRVVEALRRTLDSLPGVGHAEF
ncbi:hypothetical protein [Amycolatopsis panacis]|uniref:Alpha/beta hydrolase n=1 Tax=Amycolatopsis panacis TaxID=2340917 RepID=A0A419IBF9_9PSEU|nr:hypothetical protein [Amycolatopsis panacis]RJQ91827.1 hypothetical protein D5S19_01495 [Amycolatopsis panacis]